MFFLADSQVQHAESFAFACNLPPTLHIGVLDNTDVLCMFPVDVVLSFTQGARKGQRECLKGLSDLIKL